MQQQRPLAGRPGLGEHAELHAGVVDVEERPRAQQPPLAQLRVDHRVHDHGAAGRPDAPERLAVRAEQLARRAREGAARQALARPVQPRVGERRPQALGVAAEGARPVQRLRGERVLVLEALRAQGFEPRRVAAGPRTLPFVEELAHLHTAKDDGAAARPRGRIGEALGAQPVLAAGTALAALGAGLRALVRETRTLRRLERAAAA